MRMNALSSGRRTRSGGVAAAVLLLLPALASAQFPALSTPQPSAAATVEQTVGVTKISIEYSRPVARGRTVWGELVPFDQVWRAGANVNTRVTFSTPVEVGGAKLAAGSYGLHMIPTPGVWTVIFSNDADRWGSFGYEQGHDAARFTVTPSAGPMQEALLYTIDDITNDSANLLMAWEKLRVAIPVKIDTANETVAILRRELTGLPQFFWQAFNTAANYCFNQKVNLEEAESWVDTSIGINANFANATTKAKFMRLRGDNTAADAMIARALTTATEAEVNQHGYTLLGEGKSAEAIAMFRKNVKDHPESWNAYDSLAEGLAGSGKTAESITLYKKALAMAPAAQKARIEGILAGLAAKR